MDIEFLKMQSLSNDFILYDTFKHSFLERELISDLASHIAGRRFGVGAEGLVLILPSTSDSFKILSIGPDGLNMGVDPSALRCAGRYAFDSGLAKGENFTIEVNNESVSLEILDSRNIIITSGPPYYWNKNVELKEKSTEVYTRILTLENREFNYTPVLLSRPHIIIFTSDNTLDIQSFGSVIEQNPEIEKSSIIEFVSVFNREEIRIRTWILEKGEPLASETGACSALVASVLNGFTERHAQVHLEGGNLFIEWSEVDNHLYTTGPADYVFTGTYYYDEEEIG